MAHWLDDLESDLELRRREYRLRALRVVDRCDRLIEVDGRTLINLSANDYLGLASHRHLCERVADAVGQWGAGAGSSRLVGGHTGLCARVESRFAAFKHAEAALILPTGFMANLATLTALAGSEDVIFLDKLCHASLIDAAKAAGATVRIYPHKNLEKLRRLLERYGDARRRLIVTDSVFSMDGDCADLPALCALRDAFDAILIVDEAHATGVLGARGSGLAEYQGVAGRIDVTISTAGKALGSLGGMVTGPRVAIHTIIGSARSFIYTTAAPPMQLAAIDAALDLIESEPWRRERLAELAGTTRRKLRDLGWPVADDPTPIIPLIVGDNASSLRLSDRLEAAGFYVPAIRPPTVAANAARIRLSLRADLEDGDIERLIDAIGRPAEAS